MNNLSSSKSLSFPPGPKGNFILGNLLEFNRDRLGFLSGCSRTYGDIVSLRFGPFNTYLLSDPFGIEQVLVNTSKKFVKAKGLRSNRLLLGDGLIVSEGDFWQQQRKLTQLAFSHNRINAYKEIAIAQTDAMVDRWRNSTVIDIHSEMLDLVLAIVGESLFGPEILNDFHKLSESMKFAMRHINVRSKSLFLFSDYFPTQQNRTFLSSMSEIDEIIYSLIRQRRKLDNERDDLLAIMIDKIYEDGHKLSDEQIRDEIVSFLSAGHETTASSLSWLFYLISQHPDVQMKLQQELENLSAEQSLDLANLSKFPYFEKVVKEAMRLYPSAWLMGREAIQDCEVAGYQLRSGSIFLISQWVMHRDPRYFVNPESFNPDRWNEDLSKKLPNYAYFPFGGGTRLCIGKTFAIMEIFLISSFILQRFKLEFPASFSTSPSPAIALYPKQGMKIIVSRRDC